ncbi:hypothetical protein ACT2CC_00120 [Candidatus Vidania fulgoroideorum]
MFFFKMHSCKNDFIFTRIKKISINNIRKLSNRNTGIGFDQIFNIINIKNDILYFNIYNSNGSLAESCGNGFKCLGKYVNKRYGKKSFIAVSNKRFFTKIMFKKKLTVIKINFFSFLFDKIGFLFNKRKMLILYHNRNISIMYLPYKIEFYILSIGNPHAIFFLKKKLFFIHKIINFFFKNGVNVTRYIKYLKTYERGSGLTKCCGTATSSTGILQILKNKKNLFITKKMTIYWKYKNIFSKKNMYLVGKSNFIFKGKIYDF